MNKQQAFAYYQISPEDWRKTPTTVKVLIEEMEQRLHQLEPPVNRHQLPIPNQSSNTFFLNERKLAIVIPVLNDWEALEKLLLLIDEIVFTQETSIQVLIVDDYSTKPVPHSLLHQKHNQIKAISILRLRRNLGHQRAIAVGLSYIYHHLDCNCVVVMDGDGEDNPVEIKRLLHAFDKTGGDKIIFAKRTKRSESTTFKFFYFLYKQLYWLLTGREICVGNFSLIPASLLKNTVVISEIWNHYSSGIYRSRIPYLEINVPRTKRLAGHSKMNLVSLITHGLSSIAVYGDIVATRILIVTAISFIILLLVLCIILIIKIFTNLAIPGWATYTSGLVLVSLLQLILIGAVFSMIVLSNRNSSNIIPGRDYKDYVDTLVNLKL